MVYKTQLRCGMTDKLGQQKFFTYEKIEEMTNEYLRLSMKAKNAGDVDKAMYYMTLSRIEASTADALEAKKSKSSQGGNLGIMK